MSEEKTLSLYDSLIEYSKSDVYPFHMPGHKRRTATGDYEDPDLAFADPFSFDITEITGFDNLHHAEGILKDIQERAAKVFGAGETHFLVNGSTSGLLAAISGCVPDGGTLIMARNCHKAVYNAAYLKHLRTVYLYPEQEPAAGLNGGIIPADVEQALIANKDAAAVVVTSPTYDGVVSDIGAIAEIVHAHNLPLIVDEAHGAHFSRHEKLPVSAIFKGADVVIQSVHKTLPSLTQTALLHICGPYADKEKIRRYLSIYQSSSPSYVLMASIDRCVQFLEREERIKNGRADREKDHSRFDSFICNIEKFRESLKGLKHLYIPGPELIGSYGIYDYDISRIIISGRRGLSGITEDPGENSGKDPGENAKERMRVSGQWIADRLLRDYQIELEMAAGSYAVAIATVMDTEEGLKRLKDAILALDEELEQSKLAGPRRAEVQRRQAGDAQPEERYSEESQPGATRSPEVAYLRPVLRKSLSDGEDAPAERVRLKDSAGRISSEYVYLYPPGIPIIAPGEEITQELLAQCAYYKSEHMSLEGMQDLGGEYIKVNL